MAFSKRNMNGSAMTKALGQMVGLLLVLYVFDRLIAAIAPMMYSCALTTFRLNTSTITSTARCYQYLPTVNTSNIANAVNNIWFGDAVTLIQTLIPVLGILGAFEVIWGALKASGLV